MSHLYPRRFSRLFVAVCAALALLIMSSKLLVAAEAVEPGASEQPQKIEIEHDWIIPTPPMHRLLQLQGGGKCTCLNPTEIASIDWFGSEQSFSSTVCVEFSSAGAIEVTAQLILNKDKILYVYGVDSSGRKIERVLGKDASNILPDLGKSIGKFDFGVTFQYMWTYEVRAGSCTDGQFCIGVDANVGFGVSGEAHAGVKGSLLGKSFSIGARLEASGNVIQVSGRLQLSVCNNCIRVTLKALVALVKIQLKLEVEGAPPKKICDKIGLGGICGGVVLPPWSIWESQPFTLLDEEYGQDGCRKPIETAPRELQSPKVVDCADSVECSGRFKTIEQWRLEHDESEFADADGTPQYPQWDCDKDIIVLRNGGTPPSRPQCILDDPIATSTPTTTSPATQPPTLPSASPTSARPTTLAPGTTAAPTLAPGTTSSPTLAPGAISSPTLAPGTARPSTLAPGSSRVPTFAPGTTRTPTLTTGTGSPTLSSRSYIIVKKRLSWPDAEKYCAKKFNSHLATVTSKADYDKIVRVWGTCLNHRNMWIGLNDRQNIRGGDHSRDNWKWSSGAPYAQQNHWRANEPDKTKEDCVLFWSNTRALQWGTGWDDAPCVSSSFLSEFACDDLISQSPHESCSVPNFRPETSRQNRFAFGLAAARNEGPQCSQIITLLEVNPRVDAHPSFAKFGLLPSWSLTQKDGLVFGLSLELDWDTIHTSISQIKWKSKSNEFIPAKLPDTFKFTATLNKFGERWENVDFTVKSEVKISFKPEPGFVFGLSGSVSFGLSFIGNKCNDKGAIGKRCITVQGTLPSVIVKAVAQVCLNCMYVQMTMDVLPGSMTSSIETNIQSDPKFEPVTNSLDKKRSKTLVNFQKGTCNKNILKPIKKIKTPKAIKAPIAKIPIIHPPACPPSLVSCGIDQCCDRTATCCGGKCCGAGTMCCNDECVPVGTTCCSSGYEACGIGCCDGFSTKCCSSTNQCLWWYVPCCPVGSSVCGSSCCRDIGEECCGGSCCGAGTKCCNGRCILASETCCSPGTSACGSTCCGNGNYCCAGRCVPSGTPCCPSGSPCGTGCCDAGYECCVSGTKCCYPGYRCCNNRCLSVNTPCCESNNPCGTGCCEAGHDCCVSGTKCCNLGYKCCNNRCIPTSTPCCKSDNPCGSGCCDVGYTCCQSETKCCAPGSGPTGGGTFTPGNDCWWLFCF